LGTKRIYDDFNAYLRWENGAGDGWFMFTVGEIFNVNYGVGDGGASISVPTFLRCNLGVKTYSGGDRFAYICRLSEKRAGLMNAAAWGPF
jgi:hypothetical protein